jgi:predicted enzyme related to lactoylglutathione lyase
MTILGYARPRQGRRPPAYEGERMAIKGVAFTAYPVTDVARAVAFYSEGIGLTKSGIDADFWVEFDVDGVTFGVGNFPQIGTPGTAQSFAIEVSDMAEMRADLSKKGIESTEPFETLVCFISVVKDPDGNQLFLHQGKSAS